MPVPTLITELSTTAASNSPPGSESPASLDDYQRAHASFIAQIRDGTVAVAGTGLTGTAAALSIGGTAAIATTATTATNIAGGAGGQVLYQSAAGVTAKLANGTAGQVLQSAGGTAAPAWATAAVSPQIQPVTSSVAASALTCTLNPTSLDFRSATIGSGTVVTRTIGSAISVVVPSTATLGTVSAVQSRIVLLAIDNAGTVELAVVNIAGGNDLTETGVISTTAISATATSNNIIYSTTARTGVAYRVVGYVESTQATAGTWATAPSTIQGYGGQALAAMSSLGYGQTWQNVTASRVLGTTYYNTTGRPILVIVTITAGAFNSNIYINGISIGYQSASTAEYRMGTTIVPGGSSYSIDGGTILVWNELR